MRRAARTDANQAEIVEALRAVGASVEPLHFAGRGVPDLLVGMGGVNYLLEVKDGERPPSERELTPAEAEWHYAWHGQVSIVTSIDDALRALGLVVSDEAAALAKESEQFVMNFWNGLDRTGKRAPCPACGAAGLEVRTTAHRGKRWWYVLHCNSVQPLGVPGAA